MPLGRFLCATLWLPCRQSDWPRSHGFQRVKPLNQMSMLASLMHSMCTRKPTKCHQTLVHDTESNLCWRGWLGLACKTSSCLDLASFPGSIHLLSLQVMEVRAGPETRQLERQLLWWSYKHYGNNICEGITCYNTISRATVLRHVNLVSDLNHTSYFSQRRWQLAGMYVLYACMKRSRRSHQNTLQTM